MGSIPTLAVDFSSLSQTHINTFGVSRPYILEVRAIVKFKCLVERSTVELKKSILKSLVQIRLANFFFFLRAYLNWYRGGRWLKLGVLRTTILMLFLRSFSRPTSKLTDFFHQYVDNSTWYPHIQAIFISPTIKKICRYRSSGFTIHFIYLHL